MLNVITPAGDRHEAWALAQEYMAAQSFPGPVRWIVTDDGHKPLKATFRREGYSLEIHRLPPMAGNSQSRNLNHALGLADLNSAVVCWEDDDVYLPGYLQTMVDALATADLVGEAPSRYYNVATSRWRVMGTRGHASLACTALRGPAVDLLREICRKGSRRIDMDLWGQFRGTKRLLDTANVIGIKGLPGRAGIGVGHRSNFGDPDTTGILRKWLGDYADNYEVFRH